MPKNYLIFSKDAFVQKLFLNIPFIRSVFKNLPLNSKDIYFSKTTLEIYYNKLNVFSNLFMYYFMIGFLFLVILIIRIFNPNILSSIVKLVQFLILLGFLYQTLGLAARWIISGHAPWSNGYESMIYISWATMLAGIIFSKTSRMTLAATTLVTSLFLMVAHLNWLDPEITNLVPVLNSYWLMIHVSIITASYGFLSLGAVLGFFSLVLIILTNSATKQKLLRTIKELTLINEKSITIGLFMLTIGTFLGGVWANESWGRYWGWDPKETWALVSVLVYAFILHMRLIPALSGIYTFNLATLVGIWSIIMTYFGVNYYLSGLHSYAAGDPMPIPNFVYYLIAITLLTAIFARVKYKRYYQ
jgi:cytochrome c-type biogenesis protein CcsB